MGKGVIKELSNKIAYLKTPKKFSIRPILIHLGSVTDDLIQEDFFDEIIDFGDLLEA